SGISEDKRKRPAQECSLIQSGATVIRSAPIVPDFQFPIAQGRFTLQRLQWLFGQIVGRGNQFIDLEGIEQQGGIEIGQQRQVGGGRVAGKTQRLRFPIGAPGQGRGGGAEQIFATGPLTLLPLHRDRKISGVVD